MTVSSTILSSVVAFVIGQFMLKLFIEPVQEFKKTIADVALALSQYSNVYANPGVIGVEVKKKTSEELRKLSSRLNAQTYLIPSYNITAKLFRLPSRDQVTNAASNLIGLSNGVFESSNDLVMINLGRAEKIRINLDIYIPESERINLPKPQPNNPGAAD